MQLKTILNRVQKFKSLWKGRYFSSPLDSACSLKSNLGKHYSVMKKTFIVTFSDHALLILRTVTR